VAFRNKLGLRYSYQPVHCQQLGVLSEKKVDPEISRMFMHALKKRFRFGDFAFSEGNVVGEEPGFEVDDNVNYTLPLGQPYEVLVKKFSENCRRNIKKSYQANLQFTDDIPLEEVLMLKKLNDNLKRGNIYYTYARALFTGLQKMGRLKICGVKINDRLVAAGIFAFSEKRAVMLLSASNKQGKDLRGMFLVLDTFIKNYAEQDLILDFEGSNISSIARFFRGFGAAPSIYQRISFDNTASKLIKIIKGG